MIIITCTNGCGWSVAGGVDDPERLDKMDAWYLEHIEEGC